MIPGLPERPVLTEEAFKRCADRAAADPEVHRLYLIWDDLPGGSDEAKAAYFAWQDALHDRIRAVFKRGLDG
jgi:hypothetical protein